MATKKKSTKTTKKKTAPPKRANVGEQEAYDAALIQFSTAVEALRKDDFEAARTQFLEIAKNSHREAELSDRCRSYAAICERRLAPTSVEPQGLDGHFYLGVVRANDDRFEEALALLTRAHEIDASADKVLYARATVHSRMGNGELAIADLRSAVTIDPRLRFQATNDQDFDGIRDDASFIDIVEPTPAEA